MRREEGEEDEEEMRRRDEGKRRGIVDDRRFTGVVEEEFGHCALRTERFEKLPWKADPRYGEKCHSSPKKSLSMRLTA